MLNPSSILGVMTNLLSDESLFENWYYRRDPTHVVFYAKITFQIIAKQRGWICKFSDNNIALFVNSHL